MFLENRERYAYPPYRKSDKEWKEEKRREREKALHKISRRNLRKGK